MEDLAAIFRAQEIVNLVAEIDELYGDYMKNDKAVVGLVVDLATRQVQFKFRDESKDGQYVGTLASTGFYILHGEPSFDVVEQELRTEQLKIDTERRAAESLEIR